MGHGDEPTPGLLAIADVDPDTLVGPRAGRNIARGIAATIRAIEASGEPVDWSTFHVDATSYDEPVGAGDIIPHVFFRVSIQLRKASE